MDSYPRLADDMPGLEPGEMLPELKLAAAVFRRAKTDLRSSNAQYRADARSFFRGRHGSLQMWCELAGVEPEAIRHLLEKQLPKQETR